MYPWLGGHGSIEGLLLESAYGIIGRGKYPWLGGHGSIEGMASALCGSIERRGCVLSIHGWEVMAPLKVPGEGVETCNIRIRLVSMAGRSWLH